MNPLPSFLDFAAIAATIGDAPMSGERRRKSPTARKRGKDRTRERMAKASRKRNRR